MKKQFIFLFILSCLCGCAGSNTSPGAVNDTEQTCYKAGNMWVNDQCAALPAVSYASNLTVNDSPIPLNTSAYAAYLESTSGGLAYKRDLGIVFPSIELEFSFSDNPASRTTVGVVGVYLPVENMKKGDYNASELVWSFDKFGFYKQVGSSGISGTVTITDYVLTEPPKGCVEGAYLGYVKGKVSDMSGDFAIVSFPPAQEYSGNFKINFSTEFNLKIIYSNCIID